MKKNAFTLVELLAVIIILGLIGLLIIPKVTETIKDSRKNTYEISANALSRTATNYYLDQKMQNKNIQSCTYDFTNNTNTCEGLEFTGKKPDSGKITINENGKIAMAIQFDKYCYIKRYKKNEIGITNYDPSTCGANSDVFINYTIPELTTEGDGLYEAIGEPERYIYRGANPNNYIYLKENGTDVMYRIVSYEEDDTIKVVRNDRITKYSVENSGHGNTTSIEWDTQKTRNNSANTYCKSKYGCNAWGNQSNTYHNNTTLTNLNQDFYFYYYENNQAKDFSIKPNDDYGTVTNNSSLNDYLNDTWINRLDFKNNIIEHSFNVGAVYRTTEDRELLNEKNEEKQLKWIGKIGLLNITEYAETSTNKDCTSVRANLMPISGSPCKESNWTNNEQYQWSISAASINTNPVWIMESSGCFSTTNAESTVGVRPAFYLKSTINLGGTGTSDNPYYIID